MGPQSWRHLIPTNNRAGTPGNNPHFQAQLPQPPQDPLSCHMRAHNLGFWLPLKAALQGSCGAGVDVLHPWPSAEHLLALGSRCLLQVRKLGPQPRSATSGDHQRGRELGPQVTEEREAKAARMGWYGNGWHPGRGSLAPGSSPALEQMEQYPATAWWPINSPGSAGPENSRLWPVPQQQGLTQAHGLERPLVSG